MEYRILHVDPDPGATADLRSLLGECRRDEFSVEAVRSAKAACGRLAQSSFDAIVTEIDLPDGAGMEPLRVYRAHRSSPPVVVWSAADGADLGVIAMRAGAQDFVHKSRADADLACVIRHAVERHRLATDAQRQADTLDSAAARRRLLDAMDGIPASVHLVSSDRTITFANRYFTQTLGAIEGRACHELVYGQSAPCAACHCLAAIETGKPATVERRRADGRVYESQVSLFMEPDGTRLALDMAIDVTERREAETRQAAADRAQRDQRAEAVYVDRLRSLAQMAAGIAHELNQPLVGVRGLAEHMSLAVQRGWQLPPGEIVEKANLIVEQADRMSWVIEHARTFVGAVRRGHFESVDLNEVVRSVHATMVAQLMAKALRVEFSLDPDLPLVPGNRYSLEQVVVNLLSNAQDAYDSMADGPRGPIVARTGVRDGDGMRWVELKVIDRGEGLPEHLLSRAFEPFFTTKAPDRGIGLGLPIARFLVEAHGGTIELRSDAVDGTVASARFPISPLRDE